MAAPAKRITLGQTSYTTLCHAVLAGIALSLLLPVLRAQSPSGSNIFESHCSVCHGGDAGGGERAPSILGFVRYRTDLEIGQIVLQGRVADGMPAFTLPDDDLKALISHLRQLAGSSPEMSNAGFGTPREPFIGYLQTSAERRTGPVKLTSGKTLDGTMINESEFDAQLLTRDGKFHLLSREGNLYAEKPIEPKGDWLTYHGDPSGNRHSSLHQINTGNVQQLTMAWLFPIPSSTRLEATPIVHDGIMFITGWNEMFAIDATTGRQIWTYREPRAEGILSEAGRGANRGAAISGDRIFMVTDHAHLIALDRRTGAKLWDSEMGDYREGYSATAAPLVVGNLVVSGVAGGEEGARGFVDAYYMATGEHAWRFYTIPARGEKGAETWIGSALAHGCGATWLTGAYDETLDLIYWTTGNPCPDYNGDERKGDNLYTSSVVALSAKTGDLKWYFQFNPHDLHDWDSTQPIALVDELWQGRSRKLLLQANRNGFYFVLDRTNGELLLAEPFARVNWATGYGKDGRPILTSAFETSFEGTLTCPSSGGATNWPSNAFSPATKLFYVRSTDACAIYKKQEDPLVGGRWYGGTAPTQPGSQSSIRALDYATGKRVWEYPLGGRFGRGGILSTDGGLVIFGNNEGSLVALDGKNGKPLWHVNVGQSWQASPMTYMVGGRQFIALPGPAGVLAFALQQPSSQ